MLSHLRIIHKLAISTLAFMGCIFALIYFYADSIGSNIEFAEKELQGNEYQSALMPLLYDISKLQTQHLQSTDTKELIGKIELHFARLQSTQSKLGESLQFTEQGLASRSRSQLKLESILAKWKSLQKTTEEKYSDQADAAYKSLTADIRGMVAHAGDTSNLILDPDLDSYYLMDVTLIALPQTIDRLGQITSSISSKTILEGDQKTEAAVQARMLKEADFDRIKGDFDTSFKEDPNFNGLSPSLKANLDTPIKNFNAAYGQLIDQMNALAKSGSTDDITKATATISTAQESANKMYEVTVKELDVLLQKRIETYSGQKHKVLAACGGGLLLSILFFIVVVRDITKPLKNIQSTMSILTGGNIKCVIPHTDRKDEVGDMASSLAIFQKSLIESEELKSQQEADKNKAEQEKKRQLAKFADDFESSVKGVVSQVASSAMQMQAGAEGVTQIAADTKHRSTAIVNISTEAAQISSQVAAAAEELTASIKEISAQTQKSSQVAEEASSKAESAKQAIELLSEKSSRVSEIIEVITGIAGQINLLALNATIESARAGDAGKGFAVVASEVKNLATQVSKATGEITQQINEMQGATKTSVDSVMEILGIIGQVSGSTSAVAAAVEEQSAVTNEIAQNISRTATGTQEISHNMVSVQDGAQQTGDTANEVLETAKNLSIQSNTLKQKVDEFLATIRSA
ncbi:MAG: methyl-accepting chemotaxis protein [Alphaproteobacteria bacterium]|nr:methyl-accepting chemotaxis protein [Alphaproteobacteria bacterium]